MIKRSRLSRIVSAAVSFGLIGGAAGTVGLAFPASAQAGFFEQLFGAPPPPSDPYGDRYNNPLPSGDPTGTLDIQPRSQKKDYVEEKPVLQKPTDLMHDKTLRPGDAIMMKTGIHIYTGREMALPRSKDFVPLDDARRVKPKERLALAAMDATRNDPLTKTSTVDTLASGRSAAIGSPIVPGVTFTDQRGRMIRYVGP